MQVCLGLLFPMATSMIHATPFKICFRCVRYVMHMFMCTRAYIVLVIINVFENYVDICCMLCMYVCVLYSFVRTHIRKYMIGIKLFSCFLFVN